MRKPVFVVSDQVGHKTDCITTEDGQMFEISDLGSVYLCSENKGADQHHGYREADLRLCFRICKNPVFSRRGSNVNELRQKTTVFIRASKTQTGLCNYMDFI